MIPEVPRNVARTATHVARWTEITHARSKSVEHLSVKRLVVQLLEDASDVFVSDAVVARLAIRAGVSVHRGVVLCAAVQR
jgi:hypothetical protein